MSHMSHRFVIDAEVIKSDKVENLEDTRAQLVHLRPFAPQIGSSQHLLEKAKLFLHL